MDPFGVNSACLQIPLAEPERGERIHLEAALTRHHDGTGLDLHRLGRFASDQIQHLFQEEGRTDGPGDIIQRLDVYVGIGELVLQTEQLFVPLPEVSGERSRQVDR